MENRTVNDKRVAKKYKKHILIGLIGVIFFLGLAATVYQFYVKPNWIELTYYYKPAGAENVIQTETNIYELLDSGSEADRQKAEKVVRIESETAAESGQIAYRLKTDIWKSELLVRNQNTEEAIRLLTSYESQQNTLSNENKDSLFSAISWAYRQQGNTELANEYQQKIEGESFSENK